MEGGAGGGDYREHVVVRKYIEYTSEAKVASSGSK